jgi:hypothetical protein
MYLTRWIAPVLAGMVCSNLTAAITIQESFAENPIALGWRTHGNASLFSWNAANENLEVTWDSRETNSYFYRPLGTILTKHDDFALSFDLRLVDFQYGIDPVKPHTFQIALGFINYKSATNSGFFRGAGMGSPNLVNVVTFDYFPDEGFGASVAPGVISSNNQFAFGFAVYALTNDLARVEMRYSAAEQKLTTVVTTNGVASAPIENILSASFTDFRLDTLSINSYSDAGQDPQYGGSILAHGTIDNIVVTLPEPPIGAVAAAFSNNVWTVTFQSRTNWLYYLERTAGFQGWTDVSSSAGSGGPLTLQDGSPAPDYSFYRIRAERP